ncbi:MAG: hypothetical protein LBQ62_03620 [Candidatus Accumulibacter sp.]|jgi:hypothetical protein|nr:hypothetical protein [Accumulibacter sp.]
MEAANRFIQEEYRKRYNEEFQVAAQEEGTAFVPWMGGELSDILCERHERMVGWRFSTAPGRSRERQASAAVCQLPTGCALRQLAYGIKKRTI